MNGTDPSGKCATATDKDGNEQQVGVCGDDGKAEMLIDKQLQDPDSIMSQTEAAAINAGVKVDVGMTPGEEGGATTSLQDTETGRLTGVIVDIGSAIEVEAVRDDGSVGTETMSQTELLEHETSHVLDAVTGTEPTGKGIVKASGVVESAREARAVNRTNKYRKKKNRSWQRTRWSKKK